MPWLTGASQLVTSSPLGRGTQHWTSQWYLFTSVHYWTRSPVTRKCIAQTCATLPYSRKVQQNNSFLLQINIIFISLLNKFAKNSSFKILYYIFNRQNKFRPFSFCYGFWIECEVLLFDVKLQNTTKNFNTECYQIKFIVQSILITIASM